MITIVLCSNIIGTIGRDGGLLYNVKGDLQFFKETTMGKTVAMGYKTWESLPFKPLPKRRNIVLTKNHKDDVENADVMTSIDEVVELSKSEDVYVIGGAEIVDKLLEMDAIDAAYITIVDRVDLGDAVIDLPQLSIKLPNRYFIKQLAEGQPTATIYRYSR